MNFWVIYGWVFIHCIQRRLNIIMKKIHIHDILKWQHLLLYGLSCSVISLSKEQLYHQIMQLTFTDLVFLFTMKWFWVSDNGYGQKAKQMCISKYFTDCELDNNFLTGDCNTKWKLKCMHADIPSETCMHRCMCTCTHNQPKQRACGVGNTFSLWQARHFLLAFI